VFDWLINAGILGLAAYVAMFGAALNLLWRKKMPTPIKQPFSLEERILFSSMLAAYVAQNLFVFDQIATYLIFFAILAYIGSRTAAQDAAENRMRGGDGFKTVFIGGLCAVAMGVVLYMAVWRPLFVNRSLLAALSLQAANADATRTLERFERILPYQTVGRTEVREQLIRFAIGAVGAQTVPNEQKQRIAELAIAEGKTNSAENPGDARPVVILGNFYATIGLIEDAKSTLTKAIALSPKKQDLYFELADAYLRVNEIEEALTVLQKAFDLDPAHDRARNNLAAVFIMSGKQAEADDLLREWYGTVDVAEILFARVYGQLQNYDRLAGVWRAFVKSDPFAVEYRINLAEAYVKLNNRAEAIRTLEEAIVEIPEFRDQGNEMIQQIKTTKLF
jgi:tetratricopeptide (TPR) repeat protein